MNKKRVDAEGREVATTMRTNEKSILYATKLAARCNSEREEHPLYLLTRREIGPICEGIGKDFLAWPPQYYPRGSERTWNSRRDPYTAEQLRKAGALWEASVCKGIYQGTQELLADSDDEESEESRSKVVGGPEMQEEERTDWWFEKRNEDMTQPPVRQMETSQRIRQEWSSDLPELYCGIEFQEGYKMLFGLAADRLQTLLATMVHAGRRALFVGDPTIGSFIVVLEKSK